MTTTDPCRIRRITSADVDAFLEQRLAIFREMHGLAPGPREDGFRVISREAIRDLANDPRTRLLLAMHGDVVAGSAALHAFARLPSLASPVAAEGYVSHVFVLPEWRRRGVGAQLVRALLDEGRGLGLRRVRLHATAPGRALYERLGFRLRTNDMEIAL